MTLSMVVSYGHAEYVLPTLPNLLQEQLWGPDDFEAEAEWDEHDAVEHFRIQHGFLPPDADLSWEHIFRVTGDRDVMAEAFAGLLLDIARPPGGDDDTYDYWPSGVRLAWEIAGLLGDSEVRQLADAVASVFETKPTLPDWNPDMLGFTDLLEKCS